MPTDHREKSILVALTEIRHHEFSLDLMFLVQLSEQCERRFHLGPVSGDHTDIEAQSRKFLAKSKSNSIGTSSDDSPGSPPISLRKVLRWQDSFDKTPQQLSKPNDKDDPSDNSKKIDKISSRLFHG